MTFKQDVSDIGGMVVYVNHFMGPSLEPKYISKDFESIWINLEMPGMLDIIFSSIFRLYITNPPSKKVVL